MPVYLKSYSPKKKKKVSWLVELVLWALYLLWQHCVFFLSLVVLPICGLNQKDKISKQVKKPNQWKALCA